MQGLNLKDYIPGNLQAKIIKWLAIVGVLLLLVVGSYLMGRHDGKETCVSALKTVAAKVAERRAGNAVDATERFGQYINQDRALEVAVDDLLQQVGDYYANETPEPMVITVPGTGETVYVPIDNCPSTMFNDDELRLFNVGNKRSDLNLGNSK